MKCDRGKFIEYGFIDYIAKPSGGELLIITILE